MEPLRRSFYERETLTVAQELLGCYLVRKRGRNLWRARITETEAYVGEDDLACHASRGRTQRTEVMYGEPGRAYVYLVYGMYDMLNIVTERKGFPAAVLIRGVAIEGVPKAETDGPGKLSRFLGIDRRLNTHDLTAGQKLWVESPAPKLQPTRSEKVVATKRIGIGYAEHCQEYLWRFVLEGR